GGGGGRAARRAAPRGGGAGPARGERRPRRQRRALGLGSLAVGDVAQDGEMTAGHEPGGGVVLDVTLLTIGADHAQLARLLARLQELPPRRVDVDAGGEKLVEATAAELGGGQAEQAAGGGAG